MACSILEGIITEHQKECSNCLKATRAVQADTHPRFLTTGDVARHCEVTTNAVKKWIKAEKLRGFRTPGGHYRVSVDDFLGFLQAGKMHINPIFFAGYGIDIPANEGVSEPRSS